ncbi:PKD domain-containing protein [Shewanella gaetbuli]|uniref:Uncharacterized protein n=1 Tax=Shewanella gaetbuli TaxID=220752 RepID=A0A9X2CK89_9GAMM|nr:hypothetical protein [Shewanella gaetbuli]MCL1142876.1 hypothetical protein [Shewanella gaetbuli]
MDKKIITLLVASSFLTACNSSDDDPVVVEPENQAPTVVVAETNTIVEKNTATLAVSASDSDGSIASYSWEQLSGPTLAISGADTNTISFDAPSVAVDTPISFKVTVADNDGEKASINIESTIERIETDYLLAGQVVGDMFMGKELKASVATDTATTTINEDGSFSLNLLVDDDIPSTKLVKIATQETSGINLTLLLPALSALGDTTVAPARSVKAIGINSTSTSVKQLADLFDAESLSVSAVSTALYSLILASNEGVEPDNMNEIELIESQLNPQDIVLSAAVVKILLESDSIALPDGVDDIIDLISDDEALDSFVATVAETDPDLIENEMDAVIADPNLTPPVDSSSIAEVYYQTEPVAPTFLARSGSRYQFDADGTGKLADSYGVSEFDWEIIEGDIQILYTNTVNSLSYVSPGSIDVLSQEDIDRLYAAEYYQVEVIVSKVSQNLTRLTTGSALDSYFVDTVTRYEVTPIMLESGTITAMWESEGEADYLMRKSTSEEAQFKSAELSGMLALGVYNAESRHNVLFERLDFETDGTGVSVDNQLSYTWSVTDGVLSLTFEDFTQTFTIIDVVGEDYSTYSEVKNNAGELIAVTFGVATFIAEDVSFDETNSITGADRYWQTTVNQWTADSWDEERLRYCSGESNGSSCENGSVFFGFQTLSDNTGTRYNYAEGMPPSLINYSGNPLNWSITSNNRVIKFDHVNSCFDAEAVCRYREWYLLKVEDGILGKRYYVQEVDYKRNDSQSEWYSFIDFRFNQYELIDLDYFNQSTSEVQATELQRVINNFGYTHLGFNALFQ